MLLTNDLLDELIVGEALDSLDNFMLLGVHQPAVVERNVKKVENYALGGVLKVGHACETNVDVQSSLKQLVRLLSDIISNIY